ncbi:MAG TPA: hypothetical protein VJ672_05680 [Gemmatimonadaceae bacterium]|nr:hypothetical protein [Gemmatimonadaceae bacterium]
MSASGARSREPSSERASQRVGVAVRLFVTVWLVYAIHFSSNVVRESYLAVALGEKLSVRVDEYLGLHPDLFEIPGRGGYINNNPGASMLGAIPYAAARPFMAALFRVKPELVRPKPPATYDDARPNRQRFMNLARERGLDVKLVLAALSMHLGLMAPLAALAAVVMFMFLGVRLGDSRLALWLALLYAFGTPIFFRSAFLNQNAIVAHCVLFAYVLLAGIRPRAIGETPSSRQVMGAGALLGLALLTDYSALPFIIAFGVWMLVMSWRTGGASRSARAALDMSLGAVVPIALLLAYQWAAFGSPWFPAQRYMPATFLSVRGWNGFSVPSLELFWRNLLDPGYGLFAFSPMLIAALASPFIARGRGGPSTSELWLIFGASALLLLFSSANQFAFLQWNTGVRYMVPAGALLFLAMVPVLLRAPRWLMWTLVVVTLTVSWSVAMTRENVNVALPQVLVGGFTLPILIVIRKTASGYADFVSQTGVSPLPIFTLVGVTLWLIWRGVRLSSTEPDPVVNADGGAAVQLPPRTRSEARLRERV